MIQSRWQDEGQELRCDVLPLAAQRTRQKRGHLLHLCAFIATVSFLQAFPFCFVFLPSSCNAEEVRGVTQLSTGAPPGPASGEVRQTRVELAAVTIPGWACFGLQTSGPMQSGEVAIVFTSPNVCVCGAGTPCARASRLCGTGIPLQPTLSWETPKPPTRAKLTRQE